MGAARPPVSEASLDSVLFPCGPVGGVGPTRDGSTAEAYAPPLAPITASPPA